MADEAGPAVRSKKSGPRPILGANPRDRIHDVALASFERRGIRETSMEDIARELGVSRPALYHYFSTKDEVLLEVVARQTETLLNGIASQLTSTGLERIGEAAYVGLVDSLANRYVRLLIVGDVAPTTGQIIESSRILDLQKKFWLPMLSEARAHHGLRRDRSLEEMMEWIVFTQFSLATVGTAFGMSEPEMRERISTYLIRALRP